MGEFSSLVDLLAALLRFFGLGESAIFPALAFLLVFFIFAVAFGLSAQVRRVVTGRTGLVGEEGTAETDLMPSGKVYVHSEYWNAVAPGRVPAGSRVRVTAVDGMVLHVEQVANGGRSWSEQ